MNRVVKRTTSSANEDAGGEERGVTPVVGIILLFGMVFLGAALVAMTGLAMIDALETSSEIENVRNVAAADDHCIETVVFGGDQCDVNPDRISDEGTMTIVWWDDPSAIDSPSSDQSATIDPLGSIEYQHDEYQLVKQAGGEWEINSDDVRVRSAPDITYDGERLNLDVMTVAQSGGGGHEWSVDSDPEAATDQAAEIERAMATAKSNVTITVESEYSEAWKEHFETAFEGDDVDVESPGPNQARVTVYNVRNQTEFYVDEDRGVQGEVGNRIARKLDGKKGNNSVIRFEAKIGNYGPKEAQDVTFSVEDTGIEIVKDDFEVGADSTRTAEFKLEYGKRYKGELEHGEAYEYTISTEEDELDEPGTFYVGTPGVSYDIDAVDHEINNGTVNITADVTNVGIENATASDPASELSLDLEHLGTDQEIDEYELDDVPVPREFGENGTVTWTLNESNVVTGNNSAMVSWTDPKTGDVVSGETTFETDLGVDPDATELRFEGDSTVNVSVLGTDVSYEEVDNGQTFWPTEEHRDDGVWTKEGGDGLLVEVESTFTRGGFEPEESRDGGWQTDGDITNCDFSGCQLESASEIWWDEAGGYELFWEEGGDWTWTGEGEGGLHPTHYRWWGPTPVSVITEHDGDTQRTSPWENPDGTTTLNTLENEGESWHYSFDLSDRHDDFDYEEETRLTISASSLLLVDECSRERHAGYDYWDEDPDYAGVWEHEECVDGGDDYFTVDASAGSNKPNVRVRNETMNTVPELRAGNYRQKSADEVLEKHGLFGEKLDDGTGTLDLDENEFVFLFEVTDETDEDPDEYWEEAHETGNPNDPNFNDVIVLVEVEGGGSPEDIEDPFIDFHPGDGETIDIGTGNPDDENLGSGDTDVEVGSDHIVIGG